MGISTSTARSKKTTEQKTPTQPWQQLLADMVLWLVLVLLFVVFRATLFWIFGARLSPRPSSQALLRCFETGLRSDACAAMWGVLPSLVLTLDRKSTRLNSSHVAISYAVFCL